MPVQEVFIEVDCQQKNKAGNLACGDSFMSRKLKEEGRIICVLSDGLGSGIKACILSSMTTTMAINYTGMNEDILDTARSIIRTLPQDPVQKLSYATFCILQIDSLGNTRGIEYETPDFYLFRNNTVIEIPKTKIPVDRDDLQDTYLKISGFQLEKEDRLICFSDGVSQSGMGNPAMPSGWDKEIENYISRLIAQDPHLSAQELAHKIVGQAEKNDGYTLKDDASCCVIYRRKPRNLLICTGPPYDAKNDVLLAEKVKNFPGKKIICGGTTAAIIARELNTPVHITPDTATNGLPPASGMESADLVTEGILTLSKVESLLSGAPYEKGQDPAQRIIRLLQNSDKITFMVGTRINAEHQNPELPVELEIRRNVVKKIKYLLETKHLKDVEISYL